MRTTTLACAAAIALASVACAAHEDDYVPQIAVQPGAAARAMALTARMKERPAPAAPKGPPAAVRATADGGYVLANGEIAITIAKTGAIVDVADVRSAPGELQFIATRDVTYESLATGAGKDGAAWVEARGHAASEAKVAAVTRYTLHSGDRALLIETTLANGGDRAVDRVTVGDAIDWGDAEPFASSTFQAAVGRRVSYGLTTTEGAVAATREVALKPGESVQSARVLVVGERPDVASVIAELTRASGGGLGGLAIALVDAAGTALPVPPGAKAILGNAKGEPIMTLRASATTIGPTLGGDVPPGEYVVSFASGGGRRGKAGESQRVTVHEGATASVTLGVTDPGFVALSCVEARGEPWHALRRTPCLARFEGREGAKAPDLGGAARGEIAGGDGVIGVAIAPGKYRVTVTRGLEYGEAAWDATVAPNATTRGPVEGAIVLARAIDTTGYLAADLAEAGPLTEGRLRDDVAAGVEVARGDAQATVHAMRLDERIGTLATIDADVITVDRSKGISELIARLRDARPAVPVGGPGFRTYVRVEDDGPMGTWGPTRQEDLTEGLAVRRDVVVTNGPFVRVTANGAGAGGLVRSRGASVAVHVHVDAAARFGVDRVVISRAGGENKEGAIALHPTKAGALGGDADFALTASTDDAFVVEVAGKDAWAVTSPIWIDADGDGTSLGRTEKRTEKEEKR